MTDKVIGPGKPKKVSKIPREWKIRKWVKNTQGKQMSQDCPKMKEMGQKSPQAM